MSIWAHTVVKNEEKWVWYAITSFIDYVDRVLIWDTGSTDRTLEIIKELIRRYPKKIEFRSVGNINPEQFTGVRQRMLNLTDADWFIVCDADEIWWEDSIRALTETINKKGKDLDSIVVPSINLVGDIFHFQEEEAGNYTLAGRHGHLALRGVNRSIPGLHSRNPHGTWGWVDDKDKMIQDRDSSRIFFLNKPFLHATHMFRGGERKNDLRTPKRAKKLKYEIGKKFALDFYYPEVFFNARPDFVPNPWNNMDQNFKLRALVETPLRKLKRRIPALKKIGY